MPLIVQSGSVDDASLILPDLYVQIQTPTPTSLQGVSTSRVGIVGTGSWGPVGAPVTLGGIADSTLAFGTMSTRDDDIGTAVAVMAMIGASDFRAVRMTDGTDAAATTTASGLKFTALYTGSTGNGISVSLAQDTINTARWILTIALSGRNTETYPVLLSGADYTTFWATLQKLVNTGISGTAAKSALVQLSTVPAVAPTAFIRQTLSGGTDGNSGVTAATLLGIDGTATRTGLYALRGTQCALGFIAGDDETVWADVAAFGQSEAVYMMLCGAQSSGYASLATTISGLGINIADVKVLTGDWLYWYDSVNGVMRLLSPKAFAAGILAVTSAASSGLNKQIVAGILGSEQYGLVSTGQATPYSRAELTAMAQNGIDVITNPAPGGAYWALRIGHNASLNTAIWGDNYTRMTNFIARTLAAGMGIYVGSTITADLMANASATVKGTLAVMVQTGMLGADPLTGAVPYSVICNATNNTDTSIAAGFMIMDVRVKYLGINEKFIVNLEGGVGVTVSSSGLAS